MKTSDSIYEPRKSARVEIDPQLLSLARALLVAQANKHSMVVSKVNILWQGLN